MDKTNNVPVMAEGLQEALHDLAVVAQAGGYDGGGVRNDAALVRWAANRISAARDEVTEARRLADRAEDRFRERAAECLRIERQRERLATDRHCLVFALRRMMRPDWQFDSAVTTDSASGES